MEPNTTVTGGEDHCVTETDDDTVALRKKRSRRVSFVDREVTSVHIFNRDEDSETPPNQRPHPSEEVDKPVLGFFRDLVDSDESNNDDAVSGDEEEEEDNLSAGKFFLRHIESPSPGSSIIGSATSNNDENFFGPVSANFIKRGRLSDSATSNDHEMTMDSTAFSMHYRSLMTSESVEIKTPITASTTNSSCRSLTPTTSGSKKIIHFPIPIDQLDMDIDFNHKTSLDGDSLDDDKPKLSLTGEVANPVVSTSSQNYTCTSDMNVNIDGINVDDVAKMKCNEMLPLTYTGNIPSDIASLVVNAEYLNDPAPIEGEDNLVNFQYQSTSSWPSLMTKIGNRQLEKDNVNVLTETSPRTAGSVHCANFGTSADTEVRPIDGQVHVNLFEYLMAGSSEKLGKPILSTSNLSSSAAQNVFSYATPSRHISFANGAHRSKDEELSSAQRSISWLEVCGPSPLESSLKAGILKSKEKISRLRSLGLNPSNGDKGVKAERINVDATSVVANLDQSLFSNTLDKNYEEKIRLKYNSYGCSTGDEEREVSNIYFTGNMSARKHGKVVPSSESTQLVLKRLHCLNESYPNPENNVKSPKVKEFSNIPESRATLSPDFIKQVQGEEILSVYDVQNGNVISSTDDKKNMDSLTEIPVCGIVGIHRSLTPRKFILDAEGSQLSVQKLRTTSPNEIPGFINDTCKSEESLELPANQNTIQEEFQFKHLDGSATQDPVSQNVVKKFNDNHDEIFIELIDKLQENVESIVGEKRKNDKPVIENFELASKMRRNEAGFDVSGSDSNVHYRNGEMMMAEPDKIEWKQMLSKLSACTDSLIPPSAMTLKRNSISSLIDIVTEQRNIMKYTSLYSQGQSQMNHKSLAGPQRERTKELRCLLYKLVYEKAKLKLLSIQHDIFRKMSEKMSNVIVDSREFRSILTQSLNKHTTMNTASETSSSLEGNCFLDELWSEKVAYLKMELEDIGKRTKLVEKLPGYEILKEELRCSEIAMVLEDKLKKTSVSQLFRRSLQMWKIDKATSNNNNIDICLDYGGFFWQRFMMMRAQIHTIHVSIEVNNSYIAKRLPNASAVVALTFVLKPFTEKCISFGHLGHEVQSLSLIFKNLLDVMEEMRLLLVKCRHLVQMRFVSTVERLELHLSFVGAKSGARMKFKLDLTCLNCGSYPSEVAPCDMQFETAAKDKSAVETIGARAKGALDELPTGCSRIFRISMCISDLFSAFQL